MKLDITCTVRFTLWGRILLKCGTVLLRLAGRLINSAIQHTKTEVIETKEPGDP